MFEKEAEDNKPPYAYCSLNTNCELWKDGFQKGAEFGYNKTKEEMQEQGLALQSDMDKTGVTMFEKEGIKYALEETIGTECLSKPIEDFSFIDLADEQQEKAQCYKDGAEFGYNKAKEEMQEQGLALQSDMDKTIEQNIQLKKQIEKMKSCSNCIHYSSTFGLCHYSMGDEDYDCRGRKWEIKEND